MAEPRYRLRDIQVGGSYAYTRWPRYYSLGHSQLEQVTVIEVGIAASGCSTPSRVRVRNESGAVLLVTPRYLLGPWDQHQQELEANQRQVQEARIQEQEREQRREQRLQGFREQLAQALQGRGGSPELADSLSLHYGYGSEEQPMVVQMSPELLAELMQAMGARWQDVSQAQGDALDVLLAG